MRRSTADAQTNTSSSMISSLLNLQLAPIGEGSGLMTYEAANSKSAEAIKIIARVRTGQADLYQDERQDSQT